MSWCAGLSITRSATVSFLDDSLEVDNRSHAIGTGGEHGLVVVGERLVGPESNDTDPADQSLVEQQWNSQDRPERVPAEEVNLSRRCILGRR